MTTTTNTIHLTHVLVAPVERVYRAFLEPDAIVRWFPPHGFTCKIHHFDARVGGSFKLLFHQFC